jgi:hypothetical protein
MATFLLRLFGRMKLVTSSCHTRQWCWAQTSLEIKTEKITVFENNESSRVGYFSYSLLPFKRELPLALTLKRDISLTHLKARFSSLFNFVFQVNPLISQIALRNHASPLSSLIPHSQLLKPLYHLGRVRLERKKMIIQRKIESLQKRTCRVFKPWQGILV